MTPTDKHRETAREVVMGWATSDGLVGLEDRVAAALAKAEHEGMKRAAEIARGSSGEFDFQSALGEGRDFDYGFHNGKNHAADSILATIISEAGEGA